MIYFRPDISFIDHCSLQIDQFSIIIGYYRLNVLCVCNVHTLCTISDLQLPQWLS